METNTGSLQVGEAIAAEGATAPRVSLSQLHERVAAVFYLTGKDAMPYVSSMDHVNNAMACLTICILVTHEGFTLVGKSAPATPENFNAEKGEHFAYEDALRQIWPLEGYVLRNVNAGRVEMKA
jgi:hypothetical protein